MFKNFYILAFTLFTVCTYGQTITFHPNVNYAARKLKQNLSKNRDSLILQGEKTIRQVDILNKDFLKSLDFNSDTAKIDLKTLPIGNYIIQARLGRKRIVMYLEKTRDTHTEVTDAMIESNTESNRTSTGSNEQETMVSDLTPRQKINNISDQKKALYWVVYESNSYGSTKTLSLEYKDEVFRLMEKIELELKTEAGKNNKLLVFEVYNKSKFMTKQLRNRKYYESRKSKVFNVEPLYSSVNEQLN